MANFYKKITNFDICINQDNWKLLWKCALLVTKRFEYQVEAGDLVTEGWLQYARHFDSLKGLTRYVMSTMCRWAHSWNRMGERFSRVLSEEQNILNNSFVVEDTLYEDTDDFLYKMKVVGDCVKTLDPRIQQIINLKLFGLSEVSIAPRMGCTPQNVNHLYQKGIKQIRNNLFVKGA